MHNGRLHSGLRLACDKKLVTKNITFERRCLNKHLGDFIMSERTSGKSKGGISIQIIVALIGLIGVVGAAVIAIIPTIRADVQLYEIVVTNHLQRPVIININGDFGGQVSSGSTKTIDVRAMEVNKFPVTVTWELIRNETTSGNPIGPELGSKFLVAPGDVVVIDNEIDSRKYFYPIIKNRREYRCETIVNHGLNDAYNVGVLPANSTNVPLGYHEIHEFSNVMLFCDNGKTYRWGNHIEKGQGTPMKVENDTGLVSIVLDQ